MTEPPIKKTQKWAWVWVVLVLVVLSFMDQIKQPWGWIIGSAGGLVGGLVGGYCDIKKTKSPAERALMIKAVLLMLLSMVLFAVGFLLIPGYYRFLVFIPFGLAIFMLVRHTNRSRAKLEVEPKEGGK